MLWEARQCYRAGHQNHEGCCRCRSVGPHRRASSATTYGVWIAGNANCPVNGYEFCCVQVVEVRQQMKRYTHSVLPLITFQLCPGKPIGSHRTKISTIRRLHRVFTRDCPQRPKPMIGRLLHLTQDKYECIRPHTNNLLIGRMRGQLFDRGRWRTRLFPDVHQGMESHLKSHQPVRVDCVDIRRQCYRHLLPPFSDAYFISITNSTIPYHFVTCSSFLDQHDGVATDRFATADVADLFAGLGFHVYRIDLQPDERRNPLANLRF